MIDTKLILIEGVPGSGKTSTRQWLGKRLTQSNIKNRAFNEEEPEHPIPLDKFPCEPNYCEYKLSHWESINSKCDEYGIIVFESSLWLNDANPMYLWNYSFDEIKEHHKNIMSAIGDLEPVLIFFDHSDLSTFLRKLPNWKDDKWLRSVYKWLKKTPWFQSNQLTGFDGIFQMMEEWNPIYQELYHLFPSKKLLVIDAHDDWLNSYKKIEYFLDI